jgi:DNA repair protein RadC
MSTSDSDALSAVDLTTSTTGELWSLAMGPRLGRALAKKVKSLRSCSARSVSEVSATYGLSATKAQKVSAVLELARRLAQEPLVRGAAFRAAADIYQHYAPLMRDLRVEQFRAVFLDGKHRFMSEHLISQGTLTSSPVHPREVFAPAIRQSAAAVVLVHNHPSGDPSPSVDDLDITRRLCDVGNLIGIRVLDHVIVGDSTYTSMSDRGLLR